MKLRTILVFIRGLPEGTVLVMESTGKYHELIAKAGFKLGVPVYVLNPRDVAAFRKWTGRRAKTDLVDARLIHEFVVSRLDELRRYVPKQARLGLVQELLRVRNVMVESRISIQQSVHASSRALKHMVGDPCHELSEKIKACEDQIEDLLADDARFTRLKKVPGFQTLGAAAMICAYSSGEFRRADSFVAFLGLDLYTCQSGKYEGKRRLTKRGSSLWRKILYLCAAGCSHSHAFSGYYFNLIEHNLRGTAAIVALSRKLAKTAWSILKHETDFNLVRVHLPEHQFATLKHISRENT
jgi:transposase